MGFGKEDIERALQLAGPRVLSPDQLVELILQPGPPPGLPPSAAGQGRPGPDTGVRPPAHAPPVHQPPRGGGNGGGGSGGGAAAGSGGATDLQKAIAASMQTLTEDATRAANGGGGDDELARALEASKKEAKIASNPHLRKREAGVPTGIKNNGNSCYFNAIAQVFFALRPAVFESIMTYSPEDGGGAGGDDAAAAPAAASGGGGDVGGQPSGDKDDADKENKLGSSDGSAGGGGDVDAPRDLAADAAAFVVQWKRLFSFMHLSEKKYLDAKQAVDALFKFSGDTSQSGAQHDIVEFYTLITEAIDIAFRARNHHPELIDNVFFSKIVEEADVVNPENGELVSVTAKATLKEYSLGIAGGDLYRALDEFMQPAIENYRIEGTNLRATAQQRLWCSYLPHVLCFQLKRVVFDKDRGCAVKLNDRFEFDKSIYMDRYREENKEETTRRRAVLNELYERRDTLDAELKSYTNFRGSGLHLGDALGVVSQFTQDKAHPLVQLAAGSAESAAAAEAFLAAALDKVGAKIGELEGAIKAVDQEIKGLFHDMQEDEYVLFALFVHEGERPNQGHYWSFVRDMEQDSWIKYNDANVTRVSEDVMLADTLGGQLNCSAYFLVYVRAEDAKTMAVGYGDRIDALIPQEIREEVNADNVAFRMEMRDWNVLQIKELVSSSANELLKSYEEITKNVRDETAKYSPKLPASNKDLGRIDTLGRDPRLREFYAFLQSLSKQTMADMEVVKSLVAGLSEDPLDVVVKAKTVDEFRKKLVDKSFFVATYLPSNLAQQVSNAEDVELSPQEMIVLASDVSFDLVDVDDVVANELRDLREVYDAFIDNTKVLLKAMLAMKFDMLEDAIALIQHCIYRDEELSAHEPGATRLYELTLYMQIALHCVFERGFARIRAQGLADSQSVAELRNLVYYCSVASFYLGKLSRRGLDHLRDEWVSFLELADDGDDESMSEVADLRQNGLLELIKYECDRPELPPFPSDNVLDSFDHEDGQEQEQEQEAGQEQGRDTPAPVSRQVSSPDARYVNIDALESKDLYDKHRMLSTELASKYRAEFSALRAIISESEPEE